MAHGDGESEARRTVPQAQIQYREPRPAIGRSVSRTNEQLGVNSIRPSSLLTA